MNKHLLILVQLFLSVEVALGSFRIHQEFRVSSVKKESVKLIENVNKERWVALNLKDIPLSVTISMDEEGIYSLVFVTRYESLKNVNPELLSTQTINFVPVSNAEISSILDANGIQELEKAINSISLTMTVVSESTYDTSKKPIQSIQTVTCSAVSKKEVHQLLMAYFSSIEEDMMVWEDSN